jgi:IS30 family transposase
MASHFILSEREVVSQMVYVGKSNTEIANATGRHRVTIWRERRRNGDGDEYSAATAQARAEERRRERPLERKLEARQTREFVEAKLTEFWSPDQIAGRLREEHSSRPRRRLSHQTIYAWIRSRAEPERGRWRACLRRGGRKRPRNDRRGRMLSAPSIAGRPKIVDQRRRYGDWEGDTIVGAQYSGVIVTAVERKSGYLRARLACDRQAWRVGEKLEQMLGSLPAELRRTITFDNGKEFAEHERLKRRTGVRSFFAAPYKSWQRGVIEHTNGLLRQYFPKDTNFDCVSWRDLQQAVDLLNARPRKRLGYRTPAEVLESAMRGCD